MGTRERESDSEHITQVRGRRAKLETERAKREAEDFYRTLHRWQRAIIMTPVKTLSAAVKVALLVLLQHTTMSESREHYLLTGRLDVWPTHPTVAAFAGCCERAIWDALHSASDIGAIEVIERGGLHQHKASRYRFRFDWLAAAEGSLERSGWLERWPDPILYRARPGSQKASAIGQQKASAGWQQDSASNRQEDRYHPRDETGVRGEGRYFSSSSRERPRGRARETLDAVLREVMGEPAI